MIKRAIEDEIKKWMFKGDIIIIYGARQVGKTTLAEIIAKEFDPRYKYIDCDELVNRDMLASQNAQVLINLIGKSKVVILD